MRTYECRFYGREAGALGVRYWITATVEAASIDDARLKLYDRWEHITDLSVSIID